jgi:hypothetical protein
MNESVLPSGALHFRSSSFPVQNPPASADEIRTIIMLAAIKKRFGRIMLPPASCKVSASLALALRPRS